MVSTVRRPWLLRAVGDRLGVQQTEALGAGGPGRFNHCRYDRGTLAAVNGSLTAAGRSATGRAPLSRGTVRLLAVACGVTIANIYYAQPLLHTIARSLGVGQGSAGLVVTATQAGFAAGLVLVVPLADITARRTLFTALLLVDAAFLAGMAAAPSLLVLAAVAVAVGLSTVVVQMIVPFAATLASDDERAGVIGTVMGGLLIGVLLSRTTAGLVASVAGWRGVYALATVLTLAIAVVLWRLMPGGGREVGAGYVAQMRAVASLALRSPVLRWRAVMGAAQFAVFSCFWTTVTFLLAGRPYEYSQAAIGLFALVGAAGAGCALAGGRQLDRWRDLRWVVTGVALVLLLGSFGLLAAGAHGVLWLIAGALVMDACCQVVHVSNQAVIYDLTGSARARITTVYMTTYFAGGALGTALGTLAYGRYGWYGACAAAGLFCCAGLGGWLAARRHELVTPRS